MQIFSVVGALGAGKTTFVLNAIRGLGLRGYDTKKIAFVVNDEGGSVDGELASSSAEVVAMTNGCFTCSDNEDLRKQLSRLEKSGLEWVFLEGFGLIPGNETRSFLEECGYRFHILCLLSSFHHNQDLVRYSEVVKSQTAAATLAVGITKFEGVMTKDHPLMDFVSENCPGKIVVQISGTEVPEFVLDFFQDSGQHADGGVVRIRRHRCSHHGCGHVHISLGEEDSHAHHDVHGAYPYHFKLRPEATFDKLRKVFGEKDFLLRVKGAVEGRLFNEVHGDWKQTIEDTRRFVTFYASREVDMVHDLPGLNEIVIFEEMSLTTDPGYTQLRVESGTREDTVREITVLMESIPTAPIVNHQDGCVEIITHPEALQLAKELSRRPSVKEEWFPIVINRCISYWILCARALGDYSHLEIIGKPKNQRELSVSLVWWVNRYPNGDYFASLTAFRPGLMLAAGISDLETLIPPGQDGICWQCKEFEEVLLYGIDHGEDPQTMIAAARHCLSLANTPGLKDAWSDSLRRLEAKAHQVQS